jgi:nicotinamidase-related amidase
MDRDAGRTALLVIDVQRGMDSPRLGRRNNPGAEENVAALLAAWRRADLPLFHVRHLSKEPGSPLVGEGTGFKRPARPLPGEIVVEKDVNSAFIGTDLEACLRERGVEKLVLAGLTTDHCVSTTARMAANLGFEVRLVSDATATFDRVGPDGRLHAAEDVHEMALVHLHGEFAEISTTDEVLGGSKPQPSPGAPSARTIPIP